MRQGFKPLADDAAEVELPGKSWEDVALLR